MKELTNTTIRFNVGKKRISFNVNHNLPETFGMSIGDAVNSWVIRTNDYTAISLCRYIESKNTGVKCYPEKSKK